MKLSNLTTTNISQLDIFDVSFEADTQLFIDFDGLINNENFDSINVSDFYTQRIGELVALDEIHEPKHFGLGFSHSSKDGMMPKAQITAFYDFIQNTNIDNFTPRYVSFLIKGMGPDTVSDSILLAFIETFNAISNDLIDSLSESLINGATARVDLEGNKYIQYNGIKRKLIPMSILKSNQSDESVYSAINVANNSDQQYKRDFLTIFNNASRSGALAETLKIMKSISYLYKAGVRSKLKISMGIRSASNSSNATSIEDLIVEATRVGIVEYGDFFSHNLPERVMQATQSCFLNGKVTFHREAKKAGGNVDFIIDNTFIEDKAIDGLTVANLTSGLNQLQNYLNCPSNINENDGILVIYTDKESFENVETIMASLTRATINDCRGIRLVVMRKEPSPSLGSLQGPAKRFTIT